MDLKEMNDELVEVNIMLLGLSLQVDMLMNEIELLKGMMSGASNTLDQSVQFVMNRNDKEIN